MNNVFETLVIRKGRVVAESTDTALALKVADMIEEISGESLDEVGRPEKENEWFKRNIDSRYEKALMQWHEHAKHELDELRKENAELREEIKAWKNLAHIYKKLAGAIDTKDIVGSMDAESVLTEEDIDNLTKRKTCSEKKA